MQLHRSPIFLSYTTVPSNPAFHRKQSSPLATGLGYSSDSSGLLLTSLRRFLPLSIMVALLQIMKAFQKFVIDIVVSIKIPFMSWLERERSKAQTSNLTMTTVQILTLSFYLLTNVSQRLAGTLSIHSGQPFLVKGTFGILSTTACFLLSGRTEDWKLSLIEPSRSSSPSKQKLRSFSHRAIFNFLGIFLLMEQKSFLTALPSSLSSKGLHAVRSGKVLEIKPVEDEEQRETIRIYGKLFGCHQCGSKQFFENDEDFKVDKIPSTKIAEKINKSWWRKMFRMKVSFTRCNISF